MALTLALLTTRSKVQIGPAVVVLPLVAVWAFGQVFISPASRECLGLYRAAKTAADTIQVDGVVPGSPETRTPEARTCRSIRQSARWF